MREIVDVSCLEVAEINLDSTCCLLSGMELGLHNILREYLPPHEKKLLNRAFAYFAKFMVTGGLTKYKGAASPLMNPVNYPP